MSENYYKSIKQLPLENWFECSDGNYEFTRLNVEFGTKAEDKKRGIHCTMTLSI